MSSARPPEYESRLAARRTEAAAIRRREEWISNLRLVAFAAALGTGWIAWGSGGPWWAACLLSLLVFAGLVIRHDLWHRQRRRAERGAAYYEERLARVEGRRTAALDPGLDLAPESHPYALHLDLFGEGSVFERIAVRGSATAREQLARWLLAPAPPPEIAARQEAVRELAPRLDLREEIASLDAVVAKAIDGAGIAAWAEAPMALPLGARRSISRALVGATLVLLALGSADLVPLWPFALSGLLQWIHARLLRRRVHAVLAAADAPVRNLAFTHGVLARLRGEELSAGRLHALRERFAAAEAIADLMARSERLHWASNAYFALFSGLFLWKTLHAMSLEEWRREWGGEIGGWLAAAGEFEALLALGAYSYERPEDCFPTMVESGPLLDVRDLVHPLLPADAVGNDVVLDPGLRLLIVTGSNMSGKSTLLRSVGVSVVLAQAGAPVRAAAMALSPLHVAASIHTVDSLRSGASRFYAELTALRCALSLAESGVPVLFLLDELLHGTNSRDRQVGAREVVKGLVDRGAVGLLTTHDLALAEIGDLLAPRARNVHFASWMEGDRLRFDYRLRDGVVQGSNALEWMRTLGLIP